MEGRAEKSHEIALQSSSLIVHLGGWRGTSGYLSTAEHVRDHVLQYWPCDPSGSGWQCNGVCIQWVVPGLLQHGEGPGRDDSASDCTEVWQLCHRAFRGVWSFPSLALLPLLLGETLLSCVGGSAGGKQFHEGELICRHHRKLPLGILAWCSDPLCFRVGSRGPMLQSKRLGNSFVADAKLFPF